MSYAKFIEYILQKENIDYESRSKYFYIQNPISLKNGNSDNNKSAAWYKKSGNLKVFNADTINGKDFISIQELVSYMGWNLDYEKIMKLSIEELKSFYTKNNIKKKKEKPINPPIEVEISESDKKKCLKYMEDRGILGFDDICYPTSTKIFTKNGSHFIKSGICFKYPNGFKKIRYLTNDKKYRFISFGGGGYREFYTIRKDGNKKLILVEGESCGISVAKHVKVDVKCMMNLKNIPDTNSLEDYEEILVLIDHDKFYSVCQGLYKNLVKICNIGCNIEIRPKLMIWLDAGFKAMWDYRTDFNDLHKRGFLDEETIMTGFLSEKSIEKMKKSVDKNNIMWYNQY